MALRLPAALFPALTMAHFALMTGAFEGPALMPKSAAALPTLPGPGFHVPGSARAGCPSGGIGLSCQGSSRKQGTGNNERKQVLHTGIRHSESPFGYRYSPTALREAPASHRPPALFGTLIDPGAEHVDLI
jgi:hypothetical protein